jgi:mRNA interferase YafQ
MMLQLVTTAKFRKDYKRIKKRGYNLSLLADVIDTLLREEPLSQKYRDHALTGNYIGFRECHIQPDWLLIYSMSESELILTASRTGTHSDLFDE